MQMFPKWKYHASNPALVVETEEAEEALGGEWFDTPADVADAAALAAAMKGAQADGEITEEERVALLELARSMNLTPHHRLGADKLLAMIEEERARVAAAASE